MQISLKNLQIHACLIVPIMHSHALPRLRRKGALLIFFSQNSWFDWTLNTFIGIRQHHSMGFICKVVSVKMKAETGLKCSHSVVSNTCIIYLLLGFIFCLLKIKRRGKQSQGRGCKEMLSFSRNSSWEFKDLTCWNVPGLATKSSIGMVIAL